MEYPKFKLGLYSKGSHKKCQIECSFKVAENCMGNVIRIYKEIIKTMVRNDGHYICLYCSRRLKFSGRDNPNCKYKSLDDNFFKTFDEERAYLLGWIASDGHVRPSGFCIQIHEKDVKCLELLRNIICSEIPITHNHEQKSVSLTICSRQIALDIANLLDIKTGEVNKKAANVNFPRFENPLLNIPFIRGFFDGDGHISHRGYIQVNIGISSNSDRMLDRIDEIMCIKSWRGKGKIEWYANNAIKFLDKIYSNSGNLHLDRKYNKYVKSLNRRLQFAYYPTLRISIDEPNCRLPSKKNSRYELIITHIHEELSPRLKSYKIGLRITPLPGFYLDLKPKDSLTKHGYMMTSDMKFVGSDSHEPMIITLFKFDKAAKDITLPFTIADIIPRKIANMNLIEVSNLP